MNKVVARFADGRMIKGSTADFSPTKDVFHVTVDAASEEARSMEIQTKELKALFFVKDLTGDPQHHEQMDLDPSRPPTGRLLKVSFKDGEVLVGTTTGYQPDRPGFFLVPVDASSNIIRCYVVRAATTDISSL